MIHKIINHLIERRLSWRTIGFDDLSSLYASTMMRSLSISLIGIFIPIYLYELGYPLMTIFLFMASLFITRCLADVVSGFLVGRFGAKHIMIASYGGYVATFLLLLGLSKYELPLALIAVVWGLANSMFFVAYHVDFSKIMHHGRGGKELSSMSILERIGSAFGPVVGGVVATLFGAEYTIIAATVVLAAASVPLILSPTPDRTRQKLNLRSLPFSKLKRDFLSYFMFSSSNNVSVGIWPLFLAVAIFVDGTYAAVGLVTTIGVVAAIVSTRLIGRVVDRKQGGELLKISSIGQVVVNLIRPFVTGMGGAIAVNIIDQSVISGIKLPYTKGMYDRSDSLPEHRIAYIVAMEAVGDAGKVLSWLLLALIAILVPAVLAMKFMFVVAALLTTLVLIQNFPALGGRR